MPYLRFLGLLLLCSTMACSSSPETPEQPVTDHEILTETADSSAAEATEAAAAYSVPDSVALQNYAVDTTGLTPEPTTKIKILLEGLFHKEAVWQGAEKKQWLGLFDRNGFYELRPTTLQIKPAFDPVADAQTEITTGRKVISGREVRGTEQNVMLFITGLTQVKPGPVDTAAFTNTLMLPGKEMLLRFKNKQYRLQAFGDSTKLEDGTYSYINYGWKISGLKKGKKLNQILTQDEKLEGSIYMLHWSGDIDRDGIPDLIAELSPQAGLTRTALFLSSKADKGKLYKQVAVFNSFEH